jgi:flagellar hook-associated protein 2
MASITSAGVGSGLDVASLVTQLVAAERAAPDTRLSKAQSKAQTTLSALGTFRSALAELQNAAKALQDGGAAKLAATSANTGLLTATTTSTAAAGSYSVEVLQLAKTHKLASAAYASSSDSVGTGKLTLTSGGKSFTVEIDSEHDSLAGIRDAINAASDNPGIRASLLNTTAGVRLTLTAAGTGADAEMEISAESLTGDPILPAGTGLDALSYTAANLQLSQIDPAQNAKIQIDGYDFESQSNEFTEAVDGLRFTALKAEPGTIFNVTSALDSKAAETAVQNFVTRYNTMNALISTYTRYDATSQSGGPLLGDATVRGLAQQMKGLMGTAMSGRLTTLGEIGISGGTDGAFKLDTAKFGQVLAADPSAVSTLLGKTGFGGQLVDLAEDYLESDGRIKARQDNLNAQLKDISKQQDALDRRMTQVEARYRAQFTALDSLISQLTSTSSYLTQQLANLPGAASTKNN